jgi:hypothetical protein
VLEDLVAVLASREEIVSAAAADALSAAPVSVTILIPHAQIERGGRARELEFRLVPRRRTHRSLGVVRHDRPQVPLAGGPIVTLDKRPAPQAGDLGRGVAVAAGKVYWATLATLMRVGIDGTGATTLADHNESVESLAVGPSDVFWGASQNRTIPGGTELTTAIRRVAR